MPCRAVEDDVLAGRRMDDVEPTQRRLGDGRALREVGEDQRRH